MAYIYCPCGGELGPPTERQVLTENYCCPECTRPHTTYDMAERKAEAINNLLDRIEAIEKKLWGSSNAN